ncbi:hypothetical protein Q7P37_004755 [Cladosporium fusiforme]
MLSSDQILEEAARDGSIDIAEWPRVLENVLQRLHAIVHTEFPIPSLPLPAPLPSAIDPEVVASTPPQATSEADIRDPDITLPDAEDENAPAASQSSSKENDAPTDITAAKPPVPKFDEQPAPQSTEPQADSIETPAGTLPPDLLVSYQSSAGLLQNAFAHSPPYTIQRLAELVLYPRKHYRFLPAYLRALDRIISVSSPVSDFPLPTGSVGANGGFLTNGDANATNGNQERDGLGSDESLGGALLTPIPWLRHGNGLGGQGGSQGDGELHTEGTETILGPNGAGSIETVSVTVNGVPSASSASHTSPNTSTPASPTLSEQSDASTGSSTGSTDQHLRDQGAVTQGELLRQEQEAGVVPVAQTAPRRTLLSSGALAVGRDSTGPEVRTETSPEAMDERPEDHPHARGPDVIGMEDMGPQQQPLDKQTIDMEAAVGRTHSPQPMTEADALKADAMQEEAKREDAGQPAQDPQDLEKDVKQLEEKTNEAKHEAAKDSEGDIVVADADGNEGSDIEKAEDSGAQAGSDTVDTTTQ